MCDVSFSMTEKPVTTWRYGNYKEDTPKPSACDAGLLLGLMIIYASTKSSELWLFGDECRRVKVDRSVPLLSQVAKCKEKAGEIVGSAPTNFPWDVLDNQMKRNQPTVHKFIILSDMAICSGKLLIRKKDNPISARLETYRKRVGFDTFFVAIDLLGSGFSIVDQSKDGDSREILITGYSDQVLRYLASRGKAQLEEVENMKIK